MAAWSLWVFAPTRSWTLSEDFAAGGGAAHWMRQFRSRVFNIPPCMSAPTSCLITRSCTPYRGSPGKCVCWFFFGFFLTIVLLEANESGVRTHPEGYLSFVVLCRCVMRRNNVVHPGVALVFPAQTKHVFLWYCFENPGYCVRYPTVLLKNGKITGVFENNVLSITPSKFYTNYNNTF